MTQSRAMSLVETVTHAVVGILLALVTQKAIYAYYGLDLPAADNLAIVLIFTAISVIRGYALRRFFNWLLHKEK